MSTPRKSNSSSSKWRPTAGIEARRLGNRESDWNLPGGSSTAGLSRTRGRRVVASPPTPDNVCLPVAAAQGNSNPTESVDADDMSSLTDGSKSPTKEREEKPMHSRVIVEVEPIVSMLRKHLKCPKCRKPLDISFPTKGIASSCKLVCSNVMRCQYSALTSPALTDIPLAAGAGSALIERNSDYAINVTYVLSFIASGDGGTEAERVLGLNGLPYSTTMQSGFTNIEKGISSVIQGLTDEIIHQNICEEVKLTFGEDVDPESGKLLFNLWQEKKLPPSKWPKIGGSTDMGWQQKGSGRLRNSKSGHALIIANKTRRVIAKAVCSKACGRCKSWFTRNPSNTVPPEHECFINHHGKSGAMEPLAVLEMYQWLYREEHVIVDWLVCDDDSSIKAKLKWSNEGYMKNTNTTEIPKIVNSNGNVVDRPNHGGIPEDMPEPSFRADPNHRRKTLANELYALASLNKTTPEEHARKLEKKEAKKKKQRQLNENQDTHKKKPAKEYEWNLTMTKMDVRRISKNFAFMARTLSNKKTDEAILQAGKAVLEHHFDEHCFCGDFCRRKRQIEEGQTVDDDANRKIYRDKTKDKLLYERLQSIVARFITLDALKELAHTSDTCANESFNNTMAWLAPKNKVYCGSNSLKNRMSLAIGLKTLGTKDYFELLYKKLGIKVTNDILHYLTVKSKNRDSRVAKTKTTAYKRKRKADEYARLKRDTEDAIKDKCKREGAVYKSGIGMDGGYDLTAVPSKKPLDKSKRCSKCNELGHLRPTNKLCKYYVPRKKQEQTTDILVPPVDPQAESNRMAEEMDAFDCLPLLDDSSADTAFYSAASEYDDDNTLLVYEEETPTDNTTTSNSVI